MASVATLTQMQTRIKFSTGNRTGADDNVRQNLREAIRHVTATFRPQEAWATVTFNTVANQSVYSFSSDLSLTTSQVYAIMFVRDGTNDLIIKRGGLMKYNELPQDTAIGSTTGRPNRWTRRGNNLIIYSLIPDAVYSIKMTYLQLPAILAETTTATFDAATFPLNDEWIKPTETYAAALLWNDLNAADKYELKLKAFNDMMSIRPKPEQMEDETPEAMIEMLVID